MRTSAILTLIVCAITATLARADTYYVRESGSDSNTGRTPAQAYRTFEKLDEVLGQGDTAYIGAGTYSNTRARFTVSGTAGDRVTIQGDPTGTHTGDGGAVTIEMNTSSEIVRVTGADYYTFANLRFMTGQEAIRIDASRGIVITDCVFEDAREAAISVVNNGSVTVEGCTIESRKRGLRVNNGDAVVRDSTFHDLTNALETRNTNASIDARRVVFRDSYRAAYATNGTLSLINCLIDTMSQQGVYTRNNTNLTLVNCTFYDITKEGARFRGSTYLRNCIFMNIGSHCTRYDGGSRDISHFLVYTRGGDRSNRYNAPHEYEFDPMFTDPENGDFTLQAGSDAIDLGADISSHTTLDLAGNTRPDGAGFDMGAYEGAGRVTVYVSTGGSNGNSGRSPSSPFRTIQHAVNECDAPGSIVHIEPGVYNESVQIGSGSGASAAPGTRENPVRVVADTSGAEFGTRGAVIVDGQDSRTTAFALTNSPYWSFENLTIRGFTRYAYQANEGLSVSNNTIEVPAQYALYATSTTDVTIKDCTFERSPASAHGVWINQRAGAGTADVTITRNRLHTGGDRYGASWYRRGLAARTMYDASYYQYGIIVLASYNSTNCDITITNNIVSDSYLPILAYNLATDSGRVLNVSNNTVTNSLYSVYALTRNATNIVHNNIVADCYYGLIASGSRLSVQSLIEHNTTYDMAAMNRPYIPGDVITSGPALLDPGAGDFSLSSRSPGLDAGIASYAPLMDVNNQGRPLDSDYDGDTGFDIGAVESLPTDRGARIVRWREISGHREME